MRTTVPFAAAAACLCAVAALSAATIETAKMTYAPEVPPALTRKAPAVVKVRLETQEVQGTLMEGMEQPTLYTFWTFNGKVPGPMIRARQGDTLELTISNSEKNTMAHNIDLHAVTGPGGGAALTLVNPGETKTVRFKLLNPGFYVYHCAASPVTDHIANGMYGAILVEPPGGLPKVDREYYVMQSEFYTKEEFGHEGAVAYDAQKAADEQPTYVVFNGRVGALNGDNALKAKTGERVRVFFANIGPNKSSSFHVIGTIFDRVYREGGLGEGGEVGRNLQTTLVPAGGTAIVEIRFQVPGAYTLVDHSIFRIGKGAVGTFQVEGADAPEIYGSLASQ